MLHKPGSSFQPGMTAPVKMSLKLRFHFHSTLKTGDPTERMQRLQRARYRHGGPNLETDLEQHLIMPILEMAEKEHAWLEGQKAYNFR